MQPTVVEILLEARDLLAEEEGSWCQDAAARNSDGGICVTDSPEAISFCAVGAISRVAFSRNVCGGDFDIALHYASAAAIRIGYRTGISGKVPAAVFNDVSGRKQFEVVGLLDDAARLAKEAAE